MTEILIIFMVIGFFYVINNYILFPKEREMRNKGYREIHRAFGEPSFWEPDPTKKGIIPDEQWKARGYRWSTKYHRWYKPKNVRD